MILAAIALVQLGYMAKCHRQEKKTIHKGKGNSYFCQFMKQFNNLWHLIENTGPFLSKELNMMEIYEHTFILNPQQIG